MTSHPTDPLQHGFRKGLDQLRLRVELMGLRVDENLERIAERSGIINVRLRHLTTGEPAHLAAEVR